MKKLIAILLVLLLTASLFAGCQNEKSPATTAAPLAPAESDTQHQSEPAGTEAPATDAPVTEAPVTEAPATTEALEPVDVDGAQLLKVAAEKMKEVKSLRFKMEMSIEIIADQLGSMEMIYSADGEHTADPNATHLKGNVSLFGFMESPIEEYTFVEDNKSISYEWDNDAQTFERSETELGEKEDEQQEAKEFDYSTLDAVTVKDGGEYVVTVNATMKQARVLMQLGAGVLSGSETTEMLDADDSEDEDEKDVKLPMIFRIDEASGRITGFRFFKAFF